MNIKKEYTNGEVTIVWQPALCIHSRNCVRGLPGVFDFDRRPWIDPLAATTEQIAAQIKKCPSGALSYYMNNEQAATEKQPAPTVIIEPQTNGPLTVTGPVIIRDSAGNETVIQDKAALCRCGQSKNKPFCDGTHTLIGFKA